MSYRTVHHSANGSPSPESDEEYALVTPRKRNPQLTPALTNALAGAIITRFSKLNGQQEDLMPMKRAKELLASSAIEGWGRLRRLKGGDTMLAAALVSQQADDRRDATYVRVSVPASLDPQ